MAKGRFICGRCKKIEHKIFMYASDEEITKLCKKCKDNFENLPKYMRPKLER